MLNLSGHAQARIRERGLTDDDLAEALAGRGFRQINGHMLYVGRAGRVAAVIDPQTGILITAYRLRKSQIKKHYSR